MKDQGAKERRLHDASLLAWARRAGATPDALARVLADETASVQDGLLLHGVLPLASIMEAAAEPVPCACVHCASIFSIGRAAAAAIIDDLRCPACAGALRRAVASAATVGPYRVVRCLGRGALSEVLEVVTPSGERVALKLLLAPHQDEVAERRFEREGHSLAALRHVNVVRLLAHGRDPASRRPYLVMELVRGRSLKALLEERAGAPLPLWQALQVIAGCARGLAAAHASGIVHRDIKPSNVAYEPPGEVKVLDFGVALSDSASVRLTGSETVVGTSQYVAPEVLRSDDAWTPAVDVYSLGALAYRLLSGRPAFLQTTPSAVLAAKLTRAPPTLSAPGLPDALICLVRRMLDPDPSARPSAAEVAAQVPALAAPVGPPAPAAAPHATTLPTLPPGARFGPWVVLEPLGAGRTSSVLLVEHVDTKQRRALKAMSIDSAEDRERFRREMASLADLSGHPGIVRLHEAGIDRGVPYFVMDYVAGRTLRGALVAGLPASRGVDIVRRVARNLGRAHAAGLTHRDLKPENILLDASGEPFLTDFGVVHLQGSILTRRGEILGSPAYMAPEQVDPELGGIKPATDVYSLGCILYEVLTGRTPHQARTAAALIARLFAAEAFPRPRALSSAIDEGLEAVCLRALARAPGERFADASAMASAMSRVTS